MSQNERTEEPLSTVEGDRLCAGCSYTRRGQTVVREPHYGLAIVRCPECGVPAALQEYPLLGRWPGRIRVFVALSYTLACLFALFMTFMILMGTTAAMSEAADNTLASTIAERWAEHVNEEEALGNTPLSGMPLFNQPTRDSEGKLVPYVWNYVDRDWWRSVRQDETLTTRVIDVARNTRGIWILLGVVFLIGGCVWIVLLLSARRPAAFLIILIPPVFVVLFIFSGTFENSGFNGWSPATSIAQDEIFSATSVVVLTLWIVFGGLGILIGRSLARLGVRALLPPTLRGSLAELWFTDNKPLPTNTRAPRTLHPEARRAESSSEAPQEGPTCPDRAS